MKIELIESRLHLLAFSRIQERVRILFDECSFISRLIIVNYILS